jgi:putative ABC transport system permease protein
VVTGLLVLIALGQGATLAPALRASRVSPVEATRSV